METIYVTYAVFIFNFILINNHIDAQCPRNYQMLNDRFCYRLGGRFFSGRRSWDDARKQCESEDATLLISQTHSDVDRIREVISRIRNRGVRSGNAYIGLIDIGDGKGFLNADKSVIVRENWIGSRPAVQTGGRTLCASASFLDQQGRWRAGTCVFPQMYICSYIPKWVRRQMKPVQRVRCHECYNAKSNTECNKGGLKLCPIGQDSCQNEVRVIGGGKKVITKRCKQKLACENNFVQNSKAAWIPSQCDPSRQFNSVCRCCCTGDGCNANELPCLDSGCPALAVDINTQIKCSNSYLVGSTCTVTCEEGFEVRGNTKVSCVGSSPQWSAPIPKCERVRCFPEIRIIENGILSCTNANIMSSSCRFTCDEGYFLIGESTVTCGSTGSWSGKKPVCRLIQCMASISAPTNGKITSRTVPVLNSEIKFECNNKYFLQGSNTLKCVDQDNNGIGEWSNQVPTCQLITCPSPLAAPNNGFVTLTDSNVIGSRASFTCGEGYFLKGREQISCIGPLPDGDGEWNESVPKCDAILCPQLSSPSNSQVVISDSSLFFESTIEFSCDFGYFLVGDRATTCADSDNDGVGDWTSTPPECKQIFCSRLSAPLNGRFQSNEGNTLEDLNNFECNEGFTLDGKPSLQCLDNDDDGTGEWSEAQPTCRQIVCEPELQVPQNGKVLCNASTIYDSVCKFTCDFGYFLDGSSESVCKDPDGDGEGSWTDSSPTCVEIVCDPGHVNPSYGEVDCTKTNKMTSSCIFSCSEGYWLTGRRESVCESVQRQAAGKWSQDSPTCEEIHCPAKQEDPTHGSVSCTEETRYGAECTFSCPVGYFLFGTDFLTCRDSNTDGIGDWDADPPYCSAVSCLPMLSIPDKGNMACNDSSAFFSECQFSCDPGYRLVGNEKSKCGDPVSNGQGSWSEKEPTCEPKSCDPGSSAPRNGILSCDDGDRLSSTCKYECNNERYFLNGNDSRQCVPITQQTEANVFWTHDEPICELIKCPVLENDFQFTRLNIICTNSRAHGSNCVFDCEPGFDIDGPDDITCGAPTSGNVGTWSDIMPICLKSDCNIFAEDPTNGTVDCTDGSRYESVCIYSCFPGYERVGAKTRQCLADGSWNKPVPVCDRMTCRPEYTPPDNGVMFCTEENKFGSFCGFDCNLGYRLVGSDEAMCGVDINGDGFGDYTQPRPTCEPIFCPVIAGEVLGGNVVCEHQDGVEGNRYDSTCLLVCDGGWRAIGESRTICRGEGKWTTRLGVCQRTKCNPPLGSIPRGRVQCTMGTDYPGQICRFSCSSREFILVGTESVTCQADGKWSAPVPRCERNETK